MQSATQAPPNAQPGTTPPLLSAAREAVRAAERAAHGLLFAVRAQGDEPGRREAMEALAVACAGRTSDAGARLAELERAGFGTPAEVPHDGPTSAALLSVYEYLASLADGAGVPGAARGAVDHAGHGAGLRGLLARRRRRPRRLRGKGLHAVRVRLPGRRGVGDGRSLGALCGRWAGAWGCVACAPFSF